MYFVVLVYAAVFFFKSFWPTQTNGRCHNMLIFDAWLSFPEGGLGHLLSTDYLLSQNSPRDINTHRENEDADIHGRTATHKHSRHRAAPSPSTHPWV